MFSFGAKGMIRVGTPGNVFAIVALPPDAKRDEADFFAVCGGGGSAKTGQFNSVVSCQVASPSLECILS